MALRRRLIILASYCHSAMIQRGRPSQISVISSSTAVKGKKRKRSITAPKRAAIGRERVMKHKCKTVKRKGPAKKTKKEKAAAKTKASSKKKGGENIRK